MIGPGHAGSWPIAIGVCVLLTLAGAVYVVAHAMDASSTNSEAVGGRVPDAALADPYLVVRSLRSGASHGQAAIVPLENLASQRTMTPLSCQRVAAARQAGTGVCLQQTGNPMERYRAVFFDRRGRTTRETELAGIPSRARQSPEGRYTATTTFLAGHSYTSPGFSTRTLIHDADTDSAYDVADFTFVLNGEPRPDADPTVWGVTFVADEARFFATVRFQTRIYLVYGSVEQQAMNALRVNAECPSLSPDGDHLVYKKRQQGEATDLWRFHVLDLDTGRERKLGETRSIDDQIAWLDNERILYGVPDRPGYTKEVDIWVAPIDGGEPSLFMEDAASPTVVR